jgi:hypothetical protein
MASRSEPSPLSRGVSWANEKPQKNGEPPDADRVLLALEALRGAKWLLMLACQGLDGSQSLQIELQETKRQHEAISKLCDLLSRRRIPHRAVGE